MEILTYEALKESRQGKGTKVNLTHKLPAFQNLSIYQPRSLLGSVLVGSITRLALKEACT
jgi:hypothetical protein